MITLKQEKEVRAGLKAGWSDTNLAGTVGISTDAVHAVRKMIEIVDSIPPGIRDRIRRSLEAGLPVGAIELRHLATREWINAIRRYYYVQPFRFSDRQKACPVCKSVRVIEKKFLGPKLDGSRLQEYLGYDDSVEMFRLCEDLAAMGSSDIAVNPLVYGLVKIAKEIVGKIHVKSSGNR